MDKTLEDVMAGLKPTTQQIGARICQLNYCWPTEYPKITGTFHYIALRDSRATVDDLVHVAHSKLINFAIPRTRIREMAQQVLNNPECADPFMALATEARDLFIKTRDETGRSGELGELLLFILLEAVQKAPILASKMNMKTSQQMPVHGTDGIHLGCENGALVLYWGESKLHEGFASAIDDIIESLTTLTQSPQKYAHEIKVINSNIDLTGLDDTHQSVIRKYFNPWENESNNRKDVFACLAGFDAPYYKDVENLPHAEAVKKFEEKLSKRAKDICDQVHKKLKGSKVNSFNFVYFVLPFPSVDEAREKFQKRLWGE